MHAPLGLLANTGKGGVLHFDQLADSADPNSKTVRETLENKHPHCLEPPWSTVSERRIN